MKKNNKIISNYRDNEHYRNEFFNFISKVFPGISFKEWYEKGFWTENYRTYSMVDSGKIISNIGLTFLTVFINGKRYKAIQIGGVGTLPEYRNQGLSRKLMELILDKYKPKVDLFFLFANDSVMDFYPKFGFKKKDEYLFTAEQIKIKRENSARKLNLNEADDYNLTIDLIKNRQPITKLFGADNYGFITMWHLLNHYRDNIFYIEHDNVIIIKEEKDDTIHLLEIINTSPVDIEILLPKIITSEKIERVKYYFPPDQLNYKYDNRIKEETGLFVLSDHEFELDVIRIPATVIT